MQQRLRPYLQIINIKLIERIIDEALTLLEKVGVMIENEDALKQLSIAELNVNFRQAKAFFPRNLVEKFLKMVPHSILLYDRDGKEGLILKDDHIHFNPGSSALKILDWEIHAQRKPVTADLARFCHITQYMQYISAQSTALVPDDVPQEIADRYRLFIALQYCTKPIVTGTFSHDGFSIMKEMLEVIRGSSKRLTEKPLAIFDCCPTSPLKWSDLTCQNLIDCAQAGIPAELVPMPMTGATSPGTIVGTLIQHTAENLSGVVISQVIAPGSPVIWGGSPTAFDMRHSTTPMGAIESMMIASAYAAIGKYLNLPTHAYLCLSDAKIIDAQSGLEAGMGAVLAALSGINVISGPGMLDFQTCQSLEKLVIDNEICGMALRLAQGIHLPDDGVCDDFWGNIYDGEHFLTSPITLQALRKEFFFPSEIIERRSFQTWNEEGCESIGERANKTVREILRTKPQQFLSAEILNELYCIMKKDARKYGMMDLPVHENL